MPIQLFMVSTYKKTPNGVDGKLSHYLFHFGNVIHMRNGPLHEKNQDMRLHMYKEYLKMKSQSMCHECVMSVT